MYTITYKGMDGAMFEDGKTNPTTYTVETAAFTLNNPIRTGYVFTGWTGSNGTMPQTTVTIIPNKNKPEKLSYTANWTSAEKYTSTLKMEGGANFIVGMATEDAIARIGGGVPNLALPTSNPSIWMESRLTRSSIGCGTARSSSRLKRRSSTRSLSANMR